MSPKFFAHGSTLELKRAAVAEAAPWCGGLLSGTWVETDRGWRKVDTLKPGDRVQTFDGGARGVVAVTRYLSGASGMPPHVIRVPGGVLDTCSPLFLLAEQRVLLDLPAAEALCGSPMVLVPAGALEGWHGIVLQGARRHPAAFSLVFEQEEVVWANTGALVHCPTPDHGTTSDFFEHLGYEDTKKLLAPIPDLGRGLTLQMPQGMTRAV